MPKSRQVVVPRPSSKAGLGAEPWGTAGRGGHELLRGEHNPTRTSPSPPASTEPVPNFRGSLAAGVSRKCPATSFQGSGDASDPQRQPQHHGGCPPRPLTPSHSPPPYLRRAPLGSRRRRRLPPGPEEEEEEGGDPQHPQHGQRQPAGRPPHSGERGRLKKSRRGRKRRGR